MCQVPQKKTVQVLRAQRMLCLIPPRDVSRKPRCKLSWVLKDVQKLAGWTGDEKAFQVEANTGTKRGGEKGQGEFPECLLGVLWRINWPRVLLLTSARLSSVPSRPTCCDHLDLDSACPRPHQGHPPSMVRSTCFWWPLEPTQDALRPTSKGNSPGLYPFLPTMILNLL